MGTYYNELDPFCVAWLKNLMAKGFIPDGEVDDRDIRDVRPGDLSGFSQCHFFAGLGGWAYALELAGYHGPVWTGSCPCQPFSAAGKGKAFSDERHLWPAWFSLIRECKPARVFGEQVEAAIGWGWLDAVLSDLEAEGYACGAAVLPACSVGAPHIRQRVWFVGDAQYHGLRRHTGAGNSEKDGRQEKGQKTGYRKYDSADTGSIGELADRPGAGLEGAAGTIVQGRGNRLAGGHWYDLEWLPCTDGKARPTQPGLFPLAHGIPGRVGRLRAYGNAIVPQVAAEFIKAALP